MQTTTAKNPPIRVGTKWVDAKGREWVVYETLPGGRVCFRSGMRFGETYTRCVRYWLDTGLASLVPA